MMCPARWRRMVGSCLSESYLAEEVGFELQADFVQFHVFSEARNCKAGIVDQHIDAAVIAHHLLDEARNGIEIRHIKSTNI